jgi:glycine betaine transport system permease protein
LALGGITHINPLIIEAAEAMGSTRWQLLWKIKLPLALPVLMSGIRNMVTMTIALAGIASFVGAGGIDQRPDIINNKERFGDWEIDTIVGAFNKGAIVTLTERTTKMLLMKYLPNGKEAKGLAKAVIDLLICYLFLYL